MLRQKLVQSLLLANSELSGLDTGVIHSQQGVDVVHGLSTDVSELLDLGGSVLDLVVCELQTKLLYSRLDRVPAGETVTKRHRSVSKIRRGGGHGLPNGHISGQAEILWLEDLVGAGVVEDGLSVNASLVSEGAVATVTEVRQMVRGRTQQD